MASFFSFLSLRSIALILMAIVLSVGTALFARGWIHAERVALAAQSGIREPSAPAMAILVVRDDLPAGSFVKPNQLRWQAWPEESLSPAYIVKGKGKREDFVDSVVRSGIAAGEPITEGRIVRPGERGFLAAVLTPGRRAVTVSINATSGIAGFIFPGDRVDLILTHGIRLNSGENARVKRVSETVLRNIRILAVDQKTDDQNGEVEIAQTATLEVTTKQAEMIVMLTEMGKLSLSLRSLAENSIPLARPGKNQRSYTWDSEVSPLIASETRPIMVTRGSKQEEIRF
ncbi:MAG: Flp pilus assembly protein CpaB [Rhodospirillaceae bacterium]|nr:MAG: Flp pilus assembly protein CpaB [Rhodospirillaceae bacterium]